MAAPSSLKEARVERLQAAGWRVGGQTGPLLSREGPADIQLSEQRARPSCSRQLWGPREELPREEPGGERVSRLLADVKVNLLRRG